MEYKRLSYLLIGALLALLTSCSSIGPPERKATPPPALEIKQGVEIAEKKQTVIKTYHGIASWYSINSNFGQTTASGRRLSNGAYTAAHKNFPFGTKVRVTCLHNGRSEILRITDRGPYVKGRIIDVTIGSAQRLGFHSRGITKVKIEVLEWGNWTYKKA